MSASKRDQLVRKALTVFYNNGFHATGMDKLAKETGVSKTAIYKHFRTKDDLIQATLRLRDEEFRNWLIRRVEELADTPVGRMLAIFDALDEWFHDKNYSGCMFIKASSEYLERDHPVLRTSAEHKLLLIRAVEKYAEEAGAQDAPALARSIILLKEGAIVTAHIISPKGVAAEAKKSAEILISASVGELVS